MTRSALFAAGAGVVALHVADDSFVQPNAGTSASDHLAGGLVPLVLLALAVAVFPRVRAGAQGAVALVAGFLGLVVSTEAVHYTREVGASGDDFTGLASLAAGLLLTGLGAATLWRSRRREHAWPRTSARRLGLGVAGVASFALILFPLGLGYVTTHAARAVVPAADLGVPYERVSFETSDGLTLRGWYVPSRNGAAVIAFPGRKGPRGPARILARHGYGVLLFDRRGEGESDGDPNSFGWGGEEDILAAAAFLRRRPDVDDRRVGGIGLSVGGELMLQVAAETNELNAVVSEGAGTRTLSEDIDDESVDGAAKLLALPLLVTKTAAVSVFSNTSPPPDLQKLSARITVPLLVIHNDKPGESMSRTYFTAARGPKTQWIVPEASHMGAITARPREYERRLLDFFDGNLAPMAAAGAASARETAPLASQQTGT